MASSPHTFLNGKSRVGDLLSVCVIVCVKMCLCHEMICGQQNCLSSWLGGLESQAIDQLEIPLIKWQPPLHGSRYWL